MSNDKEVLFENHEETPQDRETADPENNEERPGEASAVATEPTTTDEAEPEKEEQEEELERAETGQRLNVAVDEDGEWHWMFFGANGRPLAQNVEGYKTRALAMRAANRVKKELPRTKVSRPR